MCIKRYQFEKTKYWVMPYPNAWVYLKGITVFGVTRTLVLLRSKKKRAACAQSFALWQQAAIEFTCHDHSPRTPVIMFNRSQVNIGKAYTPRSLCYCLFAPCTHIVVLRAHPVRRGSHIQRNATGEVATVPNYGYSNYFNWMFQN